MEFLKTVLGDELYAQVEAKLKGSNVKLADLSSGRMLQSLNMMTTSKPKKLRFLN